MEPGVLFGLLSASAFGTGDLAGGLASRRAPALVVVACAQAVGLVLLLATLFVVRPEPPDARALAVGALAGVFGGLGLVALYRGLSLGSMGLVTALSGVGSVTIPVLIGVAVLGQAIGPGQWLGVAAAIGAGALASDPRLGGARSEALRMAGLAAVGLGLWFVFLDVAAERHELWALVSSRGAASVLMVGLAVTFARQRPTRGTWPLMIGAGAMDVTGNAAFVLSAGSIPVGVAAALAGLYPIVTMVLARVLTGDALPPRGLAAVAVAVVGIVLISAG